MPHALIVEDDATARAALQALVRDTGFTVAAADSVRDARIQIGRQQPDVALVDLKLPDGTGLDLLEEFDDLAATQVVLITGHASVETAVAAMRQGAADYLVKPVDLARLEAILARVPRTGSLRAEIGKYHETLEANGRFGRLVGRSAPMRRVYEQIARVAPTEATVFITGESGTGKELVAHTVHDLSRRRSQPFLAINCGAISPNLIESEMFGHERGSFTGAERLHRGYFEQAQGGTLFLDEISEMPLELQVRLLRVLETRTVMRIGMATPVEVDVRIIAATNRDPRLAVQEGRLRADLYHRLNVFPLPIPPLRARDGDIAILANAFVDELNADRGGRAKLSPEALATLESHGWPGNVRELRNYVHRLAIMGQLEATRLEPFEPPPAGHDEDGTPSVTVRVGTSLADADRELIITTLEHCGGDKRRAADMLGICVKTLYNRLKEYGGQDGRV